jgi:hypothetical protein
MKLTLTQKKIIEMLTEDTGRHMLDSGGMSGRMWQRNQGRKFIDEPSTNLDASYGSVDVTHNIFHWLSERLDYLPEMQRRFTRFANRDDQKDESWFKCVANFIDYLGKKHDIAGGMGDIRPWIVNTCNEEDCLSQGMQFTYFTIDDEPVIALFIHGGCDVRGGYTAPKFFTDSDEHSIMDYGKATVSCPEHWWDSFNGGYTFESDSGTLPELVDFEDNENGFSFSIRKDEKGRITNVFLDEKIIDSPLKSFKGKNFCDIPITEVLVTPYSSETGQMFCALCGEELLPSSH